MIFQHAILNAKYIAWIYAGLVVKDIIVILKNETILILIRLKRYFSHPEKSILNLSLVYMHNLHPGANLLPGAKLHPGVNLLPLM